MIVEFRDRAAPKRPGVWYTYTYDNGIRVTLTEYQGDVHELEELGRRMSSDKGREVRMRVHDDRGMNRIHAVFRMGRDYSSRY